MKTFISAVSLLLALHAVAEVQESQLTAEEQRLETALKTSVVTLVRGSTSQGIAVLIDSRGLFLAHRLVVTLPTVTGKLWNGKTITLQLLSQDDPTQLVLLKALDWKQSYGRPIKIISGNCKPGEKVVALIPSGLIRAEFSSADRFGIVGENRRLIPLSEIRLESPADQIGGALVFTMNSELVGVIGASLRQTDKINTSTQQRANSQQGGGFNGISGVAGNVSLNGGRNSTDTKSLGQGFQAFGPTSLTIAYVAGQSVMDRVITGFTSSSREVTHPTIGLFCRDSIKGGALIDHIIPNSPADKAGIRAGDIIFELGGMPVRNQLDFAKAMIVQVTGKVVTIKIIRDKELLNVSVTIGK